MRYTPQEIESHKQKAFQKIVEHYADSNPTLTNVRVTMYEELEKEQPYYLKIAYLQFLYKGLIEKKNSIRAEWYKTTDAVDRANTQIPPYLGVERLANEVKTLIDEYMPLLEGTPEEFAKQMELIQSPEVSPKELTLLDLFRNKEEYDMIIDLLIKNRLIDPNTHKWIDRKGKSKGFLCSILKDLEGKGYYKKDITFNYEVCKDVAKNTFGINIKSNKTFYTSMAPQYLSFIPLPAQQP